MDQTFDEKCIVMIVWSLVKILLQKEECQDGYHCGHVYNGIHNKAFKFSCLISLIARGHKLCGLFSVSWLKHYIPVTVWICVYKGKK